MGRESGGFREAKRYFSALTTHDHPSKKTHKFDSLLGHFWNNRLSTMFHTFWGPAAGSTQEAHWSRNQKLKSRSTVEYLNRHLRLCQEDRFHLYQIKNQYK